MEPASQSAVDIGPGDIVAGKYRVVRELGRGGMGVVLAADHMQLEQPVAIKLMLRRSDTATLERFQREARIGARLQSQHACKVLDAGALADGSPFVVMEMLEGETLGERLGRGGPIAVEQAVDFVLQASEALAEAHTIGVVHRDIKPSNLFISKGVDGRPLVKVLDFGIAKLFVDEEHALTGTGELVGSPRFMAPEQLQRSLPVDMRADIWAIGVLLYELLTGRAAFRAETMAELVVLILQEEADPIATYLPDVPIALQSAVARCLHKNADRRFQNLAELALALAPFTTELGRAYVQRVCDIVATTGWSPSQAGSVPPSTQRERAPETTVTSEPTPVPRSMATTPHGSATMLSSSSTPSTSHEAHSSAGATRRSGWFGWAAGGTLLAVALSVVVWRESELESPTKLPDPQAPNPSGSVRANEDPHRKVLEAARRDFEATNYDRAKKTLETLAEEILDAGVEPGSADARVAAEAWLLIGDIEQERMTWPEPTMDRHGDFSRDVDRQIFDLTTVYYRVSPLGDLGAVQCADVRLAEVELKHARWFQRAKLPGLREASAESDVQRDRSLTAAETAQDRLELALSRAVPKGRGCRQEAQEALAKVKKFIASLPKAAPTTSLPADAVEMGPTN